LVSAPSKKSFSSVSSPILACSDFMSIAGTTVVSHSPRTRQYDGGTADTHWVHVKADTPPPSRTAPSPQARRSIQLRLSKSVSGSRAQNPTTARMPNRRHNASIRFASVAPAQSGILRQPFRHPRYCRVRDPQPYKLHKPAAQAGIASAARSVDLLAVRYPVTKRRCARPRRAWCFRRPVSGSMICKPRGLRGRASAAETSAASASAIRSPAVALTRTSSSSRRCAHNGVGPPDRQLRTAASPTLLPINCRKPRPTSG
jgi:hypothetical protein